MLEMAVTPPKSSLEKGKRIFVSIVRGDFVSYLVDFCRGCREFSQTPIEPLLISGDDEHMWIGLEP